ncbi:MAG: germination protein YpeB, partial [Clostridia bacterium]|nr:germination protein YpeB [Clostridia bacterium]
GTVRAPDYALLVRLRDFALPLTADILPNAIRADMSAVDEGALAAHLAGLGRLYYDGAGSDIVPPGGYLSLLSATRYTQSDAYAAAQAAVGRNIRLKATAAEGDPARFCFTSANLTVIVSERGGHLLHLLYDQSGREGNIGRSAALAAAERAVGAHAPEPLVLTGEEDGEGTYYFTFAPQRGDLLCLSERILVGIDASSGRLCLWDADWYYRYRTAQRTYPDNLLSPDLIAARYGGTESPLLCTAVRADGRELLCYRLGEGERAIFLNAVTGKVEQTA